VADADTRPSPDAADGVPHAARARRKPVHPRLSGRPRGPSNAPPARSGSIRRRWTSHTGRWS